MIMNVGERIYNSSPIWMQHILTSLRGWEYRHRRASDRLIHQHLAFLLESQSWPTEMFVAYQTRALRELLSIAFRDVPYYRRLQQELGCHPEDFKSPEDLRYLPILDKQMLRGHERDFVNEHINLKKCSHGFTSGTTGTPIHLYESQQSFAYRWAFVARLRTWAGLTSPLYPRRAQFTGRNIVPGRQRTSCHIYWRYNYPGNALLFSTTHLTVESVPYYARKLREYKPDLIEGYPSAMLIVARVARRLGIELPQPRAIIVSAETLFPDDRKELEEAFNCRVFNQYAASEPSCFWCDCEAGTMHINPEYGISELVDPAGRPVSPGQVGEVVVTSFLNPVMPLIRYRLGDLAILRDSTVCACGREMPQAQEIVGRVDDVLYVPQRGYVGRLDPVFKGLSHIVEAQIVQETLNRIRVLLVPDTEFNFQLEQKLLNNLRAKLGDQVQIEVTFVEKIPRGANGKFRSVVSKVKHQYPDPM